MKDSPSLSGSLVKPAAALCHAWAIVSKQMAIPVAGALVLCGRVASKKEILWSFTQALHCSREMGSKSRSKQTNIPAEENSNFSDSTIEFSVSYYFLVLSSLQQAKIQAFTFFKKNQNQIK